jgi:hypothetical protein
MRFFTTESIGRTRSLTPEGFLLCRDAVLARTGTQVYGPDETPITGDDMVQIERDPEEVFNPDTIASAQGKPVVNEHPMSQDGERCDVNLDNWRDLTVGTILNARQGQGIDNDLLVADLLITDRDAIDLILRAGKRELSCGYDADYVNLGPNHGAQRNIRINHVALVDQGRCGPRCAIGDGVFSTPLREDGTMKLNLRAIRRAFRDGDEEKFEDELKKTGDGDDDDDDKDNGNGNPIHTHVHLENGGTGDQGGEVAETMGRHDAELEELWQANQMEASAIESLMGGSPGEGETSDAVRKYRDAKFPHRDARRKRMGIGDNDPDDKTDDEGFRDPPAAGGLEAGMSATAGRELELEAPAGTQGDALRRARDSALLEDSWAETMSRAELIMPGVRLPTFDRAARPMATVDQLCAFRSRVLDAAYQARPEVRELMDEMSGGRWRDAKTAGCSKCRDTFRNVSTMLRRLNGSGRVVSSIEQIAGGGYAAVGAVGNITDWQKSLDDTYGNKH